METIKLSKSQWEFIGKKTGWIKKAQIIHDDGIADGGEPYTEDEMDLMDEQRERDERIAYEKKVILNKILNDIEDALQKGKIEEKSLGLIKQKIDQWSQNYFRDLR